MYEDDIDAAVDFIEFLFTVAIGVLYYVYML